MPERVTPSLGPLHAVGVLQTHEGDAVVVDGGRLVGEEWELIRHGVLSGASPAHCDAGSRQKSTDRSWSGPIGTFAVGFWPQTSPSLPRGCPKSLACSPLRPTWRLGQEAALLQHLHCPSIPWGRGSQGSTLPPAPADCRNPSKAFLSSGSQFPHL